jgi:sugar/nucleoside kinase (ribokinase family)
VKYVVVSNVITDDVVLADGTRQPGLLGGAATYAAAGMRAWSSGVGVVSGIGRDFEKLHGDWFRRNDIDAEGLQVRSNETPRSWVVYRADGEREERPQFGYEHFALMEPMPHDIPERYRQAQGIYVFRDDHPDFWLEMLALRNKYGFTLLWEIAANVTNPSHWDCVRAILGKVDLFSINQTEANQLCQARTPEEAVECLLSAGVKVVALRMGQDGALVADRQSMWHIPAVQTDVVDVTGAGNAFSGGFLVGYCESRGIDLPTAGAWGAVSAALMIRQYGPPATINAALAQQYASSIRPARRG